MAAAADATPVPSFTTVPHLASDVDFSLDIKLIAVYGGCLFAVLQDHPSRSKSVVFLRRPLFANALYPTELVRGDATTPSPLPGLRLASNSRLIATFDGLLLTCPSLSSNPRQAVRLSMETLDVINRLPIDNPTIFSATRDAGLLVSASLGDIAGTVEDSINGARKLFNHRKMRLTVFPSTFTWRRDVEISVRTPLGEGLDHYALKSRCRWGLLFGRLELMGSPFTAARDDMHLVEVPCDPVTDAAPIAAAIVTEAPAVVANYHTRALPHILNYEIIPCGYERDDFAVVTQDTRGDNATAQITLRRLLSDGEHATPLAQIDLPPGARLCVPYYDEERGLLAVAHTTTSADGLDYTSRVLLLRPPRTPWTRARHRTGPRDFLAATRAILLLAGQAAACAGTWNALPAEILELVVAHAWEMA